MATSLALALMATKAYVSSVKLNNYIYEISVGLSKLA